ncbi:MAG TPA: LysM peptidoglycan-binding domain-containing protein [Candidatus Saccharimonadales bacterium]|nr:LysM peptidoglycan-binding domain-containing protein [Candidatus Saccharimonadales bacterium]
MLVVNLLFLAIVFLVLSRPQSTQAVNQLPASGQSSTTVNPLDQLASADVAETIAEVANLPEATAIRNQADSVNAELAITPADNLIAQKPQVVATNFESNQAIRSYVVKSSDTVASLANKFDITSNSIEWSNGLLTGNLIVGSKLLIPPVTGIVYTVKSGDTIQSLAQKYGTSATLITSFNDAEISGIHPGELIVIPGGQAQTVQALVPSGPTYNFYATYGSNGYDFGYCTYYVASQIAVPTNWGNASSWAYYARLSGWTVSSTPTIGSIAQTPFAAGGQGHVAIVVAVSGTNIEIKDMNNYGDGGGYDKVGEGWVSTSYFPNYITH